MFVCASRRVRGEMADSVLETEIGKTRPIHPCNRRKNHEEDVFVYCHYGYATYEFRVQSFGIDIGHSASAEFFVGKISWHLV